MTATQNSFIDPTVRIVRKVKCYTLLPVVVVATILLPVTTMRAQPYGVFAWGDVGQGGYGAINVPGDLTNAVRVSAASSFNLALLEDGTLRNWGGNGYPPPGGLNNVQAMDMSSQMGLALMSNGTVTAWGQNYYGGTDVPSGLNNVTAVAAGNYHGLALKNDGSLVGWGGQDGAGSVPAGLTGASAISAGLSHSLVLKSNGTVEAWGWNNLGQATVPSGLSNVIAVSAGGYHSVALKNDGTVVVWGGQNGLVQPPIGLSNVVAISAGTWHNLAIKSDGSVAAWGENSNGQLNVPAGLRDVVRISAGHSHSIALSASPVPLILTQPQDAAAYPGSSVSFTVTSTGPGSLTYQWLKDGAAISSATAATLAVNILDYTNAGNYAVVVSNFGGSITSALAVLTVKGLTTGGALVNLNEPNVPTGVIDVIAVAAIPEAVAALRADGKVVAYSTSPFVGDWITNMPAGLSNVQALAVGGDGFALALQSNGTVVGWGLIPATPAGLSNVTAIAASHRRAYALKSDGTVANWGFGATPGVLTDISFITGGFDSGLAVRTNGTAISWGFVGPGVFSAETNLTRATLGGSYPGGTYALGLRADGTVAGSGVPPGLSGVTAISSGGGYGLALKNDGTIVGLGNATVTATVSHATAIAANGGYGLVITRWPAITGQPQSVTNQPASSVVFTVTAKGFGPFTYQWQKGGTDIPGESGITLTLNNVGATNADIYSVIVSNSFGSVTSTPAMLSLYGIPQITSQPKNQTVFEGARVVFAASATGSDPLIFQWYHDDASIEGATSNQLVIPSVATADAGTYTVVVTNSEGQATSEEATLTVTTPPAWSLPPPGSVVGIGGPIVPPTLTNAVAVAAGTMHGLALKSDSTVAAWGRIYFQEASVPEGLSNIVAIAAGDTHSLALKRDGTVVSWGFSGNSGVPADLYGVIGIAAGYQHSLAIKSDGSVRMWGGGNLANPPASVVAPTMIDAGFEADTALNSDGTVITWGGLLNPGGQFPTGLSNILAVSLGRGYLLGLRADGTVAGNGVPPGLSNVVKIAGGGSSLGLALKNDGTVTGWGGAVIPEGLSGVTAIAAGGFGLLISTNPPQPALGASAVASGGITLVSPVSVAGYVLEAADNMTGPFVEVPAYTNSLSFTNTEDPGVRLPANDPKKIYRMRKK